jgi:prepilin-type N-terminal cleavage/methylation domain-containing protein
MMQFTSHDTATSLAAARPPVPWRARRRQGLTFVELMVAVSIGSLVSVGLASLLVMSARMQKSIMTQQLALRQVMKGIEGLNREIRMASVPLQVTDADGAVAVQGNRVLFSRLGEPAGRRSIELVSTDSDFMTAADNRLVLDPDTTKSGDEIVLARGVTPLSSAGAFRYEGTMAPLQAQMRVGDPVSGATAASDAATGYQMQGLEINISIAPRNDSSN